MTGGDRRHHAAELRHQAGAEEARELRITQLPRGVRVMVRSSSGDIEVRGVNGEVEASTNGGDVIIEDQTGERLVLADDPHRAGAVGHRLAGRVHAADQRCVTIGQRRLIRNRAGESALSRVPAKRVSRSS